MKTLIFIARRYLIAERSHRAFSWISVLSIGGIAIGVCAMIVVLSVIDGFEAELKRRLLVANAHIMLYRYPYGLKDHAPIKDELLTKYPREITGVTPFIYHETVAKFETLMHPIVIRGILPSDPEHIDTLGRLIHPPSALQALQKESEQTPTSTPGIIIGKSLLSLLGAKVGDSIHLVAPSESSLHDFKAFRVLGVFDTGLMTYDKKFGIMALPTAQDFFDMTGHVTGVEVSLKDPFQSRTFGEKLSTEFNLSLKEWQSFNYSLFEAMNIERVVIAFIVALVAIVASFNILTTMFVSVTQKQRDISILKALGARNHQILLVFLGQGLLISVLGSAIGVAMALGLCEIIKNYPIIELPDIYILTKLPVEFEPEIYVSVMLGSLLLSIFASIGPAMIAARVSPSEGFRNIGGFD